MTPILRNSLHNNARRYIVTAAIAASLAAIAFFQRPMLPAALPRDAGALEFVDRNGLRLGTVLGRDERHTMSVPLERIAPAFRAAVIATEDRRFFEHGTLDVPSTARALALSIPRHSFPGGASTLALQLGRLIEPVSGSPLGKLREILFANRLELGMSKNAILEAYANRAPMGSNLYGVEAAARTYFGTHADEVDLAQAALLAALPNDPVRLDPYRHRAALEARRRFVLERMRACGFITQSDLLNATRERVTILPRNLGIVAAPHFLFAVAREVPADRERVRTTIDLPLQQFVEAQVRAVVATLGSHDVRDAAAIVIDNRTAQILAYVGSPDYFADADFGRNDGVQALRQPGSALKPFLYELALERRAIRPQTILADVPVAYALPDARLYRPSDYSTRFAGPVRVRIALADSLNVPAVRVLERVGVEHFLDRLHELGFTQLERPAAYYGLGLTLGGGEVSLYELARAYLTAARGGTPVELRGSLDAPAVPEAPPGNPAWALVTDMLADDHARALAFGTHSILSLPFPAAVKTGTSSDFRDTWTAGYSRDYTVAVWVGNFDGSPMRGISGVTGAAPLWSRIMLHLHEQREPAAFDPPRGYVRRPICAQTGTRPFPGCVAIVTEWLDRGDLATYAARRASGLGDEYDTWLAAQPARESPATRILFPREGDTFVLEPGGAAQTLKFEIGGRESQTARLFIDGAPLARTGHDYLWKLRRGSFDLRVRAAAGQSGIRFNVVAPAPRRPGFTLAASRSNSAETR
jgi:penicillin-binding protein 1C